MRARDQVAWSRHAGAGPAAREFHERGTRDIRNPGIQEPRNTCQARSGQ